VNTEQELLAVVGAEHAPRLFARGEESGQKKGGQEKGGQNAEDGDDDEEFDEGEGARTALPLRSLNGEWHGFPFA